MEEKMYENGSAAKLVSIHIHREYFIIQTLLLFEYMNEMRAWINYTT